MEIWYAWQFKRIILKSVNFKKIQRISSTKDWIRINNQRKKFNREVEFILKKINSQSEKYNEWSKKFSRVSTAELVEEKKEYEFKIRLENIQSSEKR